MTKKYFQAKRQRNPLAQKHPNSKKNRIIAIALMTVFVALGVSSVVTSLSHKNETQIETKINKSTVNTKDAHPKKVVKPIADEDFKGAKEYNFYTQLEERSLILGEEERFGGIPLENIHEPPKINLESASTSVVSGQSNEHQNLTIAPLVLESALQKKTQSSQSIQASVVVGGTDLQVGSFSARKDAEKHQAFLAKNGLRAEILPGKNQAQKNIYRVRVGGLSPQDVGTVKKKLNALGVNYFEVK